MHNISIDDDLYSDIKQYCKLNNIKISIFCNDLIKKYFNNLKYGDIPFGVIEQLYGEATPVEYVENIDAYIEPIKNEEVPIITVKRSNETPNEKITEKKTKKRVLN